MGNRRRPVLFLIMVIAVWTVLPGCGPGVSTPEAQDISVLSGAYRYGESITADILYTDSEEAPVFIFTNTDLVLFQRDLAHYSPRSSAGRYDGSRSTYARAEMKEMRNPRGRLADAGVDTAAIASCRGYTVLNHQLACFLVDGQIWIMQYHREHPFVFSIERAEQLELQTIDSSLKQDGEDKVVLVDTSAPQLPDIEDASLTEQDVLHALGVSDRAAGVLVAYDQWASDYGRKYFVFEFEADVLRARAEYLFCSLNEDGYAAARSAAAMANGWCNEQLRLLKTTYAYDVELPVAYRGLSYDQLEAALKDGHATVIEAVAPNYKSLGPFSFADLSSLEFWFASGAGGWRTTLTVHADGTFAGNYRDSDMGFIRLCNFTGQFSNPIRVNEYTYSVRLEQITQERESGDEEWRDGVILSYCQPYGLDNAEELLFYLPGAPVEALPEGYRQWMGTYGDYIGTELPFYGLYNVGGDQGYSSHMSETVHT